MKHSVVLKLKMYQFYMKIPLIVLLFLVLSLVTAEVDYQAKIDWLYKRLQSRLWTRDQPFRNPSSPQHMKGLYESHIRINFVDKKNTYYTSLLRKNSLDDNNMFVTSFVLYSLIETAQLETISLDDHLISMSLETLATFRDKNTPYGVPQYNFWPQHLVNGTWIAQPVNLINIANMIPSKLPKPIMFIFQKLGLDIIIALKDLVNVFTIPADNDDSSVNMALLGLLKQTHSKHFPFWKSFNYNIEAYYQNVLKYAYRPFDKDFKANKFANQIDPRIYYLYSDFFEEKKQQADRRNLTPSLILPTTWLISYEQQISGLIRMPFSNNNVDATVCANVLFGISYLVLNNQLNLQNVPELKLLVSDTSELLAFVIKQKITQRPDLALVYYPSKYDFFWFVSRIINLYKRQDQLSYPFDIAYQNLINAMKTKGTEILLNSSETDKNGEVFWSEFLGNYAKKNRNQDAIFSTSLALNALLDTWTLRKGNNIKYDSDIPSKVRQTIKQGISYLCSHLKNKMKEQNAFFSGSWKSDETNPYIYPANIHVDKNNKNIDPNTGTYADIRPGMNYVMKGFIDSEEYKKMLSKKWFDQDVPTQFKGFNQSPFPYWSAEPITQVICLSVLSKFIRSQSSLTKQ